MTGKALKGVKILDFTWAGAGPIATKNLADFGATVVKVESSKRPDWTRLNEPYRDGIPGLDRSPLFIHVNTSKLSMALDLSHPRGVEIAKRLVKWADVVMENFSPGVIGKLGLGYEELRKVKKDIIMVGSSILGKSGVGEGFYSSFRGWGNTGAAVSGHYYLAGWPDGGPAGPAGIAYADVIQPLFSASAILAALDYKRRTGKGQYIDITQLEVMVQLLGPTLLDYQLNGREPVRMGNRHPTACPHGAFKCQGDDEWCAIAVFTDQEWQGFCHALGRPAWTQEARFATAEGRKAHEDEIEGLVESWTEGFAAQEVAALMQEHGVPAGVVQTAAQVVAQDPYQGERGVFQRLAHPVIGECNHPVPPFRLSATPAQVGTAPLLGEHTEHVCTSLLGMSQQEFHGLRETGVFA